MTPTQKVALKISETRERLNVLLNKEDRSAEETGELDTLTAAMKGLEIEARAAIAAEPNFVELPAGDGESKELRELAGMADLGVIMTNVVEHRAAEGREKEIQDHFKLAGNQIPLAMLRRESRAAGVTPAPSSVGTNQAEIIPDVFPDSMASFLNISTPTVGVGEVNYPVLSTSADVGVPAENASQDETAGGFTANVLSPKRIQAAFFYSREDAGRFAGMDASLRMNLGDALSDKLDQQILNGSEGLFNGTKLPNHNVSAVTSYALYKSLFAFSRVDGKWASSVGDLKIVTGSATYAHAATQYRGNNADQSALDELMEQTAGVRVSAHVPAVVSSKQNSVIRLGSRMDAIAPIWEGVTLITDEVTLAKKGQIQITAIMLFNSKILRAAGFYKQQSQHA